MLTRKQNERTADFIKRNCIDVGTTGHALEADGECLLGRVWLFGDTLH